MNDEFLYSHMGALVKAMLVDIKPSVNDTEEAIVSDMVIIVDS